MSHNKSVSQAAMGSVYSGPMDDREMWRFCLVATPSHLTSVWHVSLWVCGSVRVNKPSVLPATYTCDTHSCMLCAVQQQWRLCALLSVCFPCYLYPSYRSWGTASQACHFTGCHTSSVYLISPEHVKWLACRCRPGLPPWGLGMLTQQQNRPPLSTQSTVMWSVIINSKAHVFLIPLSYTQCHQWYSAPCYYYIVVYPGWFFHHSLLQTQVPFYWAFP